MRLAAQFEYFILRYVPSPLGDQSVNIGLVVFTTGDDDFAVVRFLKSWEPVLRLDPQADIEYLNSFAADVSGRFQPGQKWEEFVRIIKDSFSNTIQATPSQFCMSQDPSSLVESLTIQFLPAQ